MQYLTVALFLIVWVYILIVTKRNLLESWFYIIGSVVSFILAFMFLQPIVTPVLARVVTLLTGFLGEITQCFESFSEYGILFIKQGSEGISLYIDTECAGFIEISAFVILVAFFSIYNPLEKMIISIIGTFFIVAINILRLFSICLMIYYGQVALIVVQASMFLLLLILSILYKNKLLFFIDIVANIFLTIITLYVGSGSVYYVAHTIYGRFIFYMLYVLFSYTVFTKGQITRQKVGKFNYESNSDNTIK